MPVVGAIPAVGTTPIFRNDVAALPTSPEFSVGAADPTAATSGTGAIGGFGQYLTDKVASLEGLQQGAATQSQALATGQAQDASAVVMQVEHAALAMQLAVQVRNKAVEAYQEILHLQI